MSASFREIPSGIPTVEYAALTRAAILAEWSRDVAQEGDDVNRWKHLWRKWPLWMTLIGFALFGIALILLPVLNEWSWDRGVVKEFGVAFLIAAILGGSIHVYLERDIAKDAFEGAIGYVLPPDVKEAVRFLSGLEWFAEEFSIIMKIERVDGDLVKATVKIRKFLRNITNISLPIKSTIHIDDWGHKEKSNILECELQSGSGVTKRFDSEKIKYENMTVYAETEEVQIRPRETVTLLATAVEFKHLNDDLHFAMPYASKSPEIYVEITDDFEHHAGFSATIPSERHPHTYKYVLKGFCLPWQRAVVRWWPKEPEKNS